MERTKKYRQDESASIELTEEQKGLLAQAVVAGLYDMAALATTFDPVVGQCILNFALLVQGGRGDLILKFVQDTKCEAMRIMDAAFAEAELLDAARVD